MSIPLSTQRQAWTAWNATAREQSVDDLSERHSRVMLEWMQDIGRRDLDLLDAGCGSGWMAARLMPFGKVTAIDIVDEVLARAARRWPDVTFIAGDFFETPFADASFDVIVSLEVLAHVADQPAYVAKIAKALRPGGHLLMATQNKPVLELNDLPPAEGWLRRWVDRAELAALLTPHFAVLDMITVEPRAKRGILRYLTAGKVKRLMNAVTAGAYQRSLERQGFGWSIMCRARKLPTP